MGKGISKTLVPEEIIRRVAEFYNIGVEDLIHGDRREKFCEPRHVAMYLCHSILGMDNETIGICFGKCRPLARYAVEKVKGWVAGPRFNRKAAACVETILDDYKKIKR